MKRFVPLFICLCMSILASCSSKKPRLHIYTWADFFNPEVIERFEKEHNCQVVLDTFDSNEAMYTKLKLGSSGYDLILPSNYFVQIMSKQQMLQPIDLKRVPNIAYFDPAIAKRLTPQLLQYGVPYLFTFSCVAWRKDKVEAIEPSWDVFDLRKYKGRMTMLNDPREVLGAGLRFLGYSINTKNPDEIDQAKRQAIAWKQNLAKFESEQYKNGIASGEYLIVQAFHSDIIQVMQENPNVTFGIPKEGSWFSVDFFVIPKDAPHIDLAYDFINYMYLPEVAIENMNYTCCFCPNIAAYDKVLPVIKDNILPLLQPEILEKSEMIQDVGRDTTLYNKAWEEIKAAK